MKNDSGAPVTPQRGSRLPAEEDQRQVHQLRRHPAEVPRGRSLLPPLKLAERFAPVSRQLQGDEQS